MVGRRVRDQVSNGVGMRQAGRWMLAPRHECSLGAVTCAVELDGAGIDGDDDDEEIVTAAAHGHQRQVVWRHWVAENSGDSAVAEC